MVAESSKAVSPWDVGATELDEVGQIVLRLEGEGDFDVDGEETARVANRYLWTPAVDEILADEQVSWDGSSDYDTDTILWPATDIRGSVRDLVEFDAATGDATVVQHRTYDAFGALTEVWELDGYGYWAPVYQFENATVTHLFGFTGRPGEVTTGLQNNLNRWYDAEVGSWLNEDLIGFEGGDANLYRYCGNDPVNGTDPNGQIVNFVVGAGIGVVSYWLTSKILGTETTTGGYLGAALGGALTCGLYGPLAGAGTGLANTVAAGAVSSAVGGMASSALRQWWDTGTVDLNQVGQEGLICGVAGGVFSFFGGAFAEILGASGGGPGAAAAGAGGGVWAFAASLAFSPASAIAPAIAFAGPGMTTAFSTGQGGGGDANESQEWTTKARMKTAGLPNRGRIRYVPPENYNPKVPLPRGPEHGYLDRFGNEWVKGPSRTAGEAWEWDVQLSNAGREMLDWLSREGAHVNVSLGGEVTHL